MYVRALKPECRYVDRLRPFPTLLSDQLIGGAIFIYRGKWQVSLKRETIE